MRTTYGDYGSESSRWRRTGTLPVEANSAFASAGTQHRELSRPCGLLELLAVKAARAVLRGRRAQQCARRYPTCDVMSHVMSDHVDWRSVSEDVIRSSVRGTVPVLACVVGDCGVRSPG